MKKVPRSFRIDPTINEELVKKSAITGIPETTILEDALRDFLTVGLQQRLRRMAKLPVNTELVRGEGFEPSTPTVSMLGSLGANPFVYHPPLHT